MSSLQFQSFFLSSFYQAQLHRRRVWESMGGTSATCANTRWPYQCSTLASFLALFHLQRKERLPFIRFLLLLLAPVPSTFVLIVVTYIYVNIIMNNRSINSLMRQYVPVPPLLLWFYQCSVIVQLGLRLI